MILIMLSSFAVWLRHIEVAMDCPKYKIWIALWYTMPHSSCGMCIFGIHCTVLHIFMIWRPWKWMSAFLCVSHQTLRILIWSEEQEGCNLWEPRHALNSCFIKMQTVPSTHWGLWMRLRVWGTVVRNSWLVKVCF